MLPEKSPSSRTPGCRCPDTSPALAGPTPIPGKRAGVLRPSPLPRDAAPPRARRRRCFLCQTPPRTRPATERIAAPPGRCRARLPPSAHRGRRRWQKRAPPVARMAVELSSIALSGGRECRRPRRRRAFAGRRRRKFWLHRGWSKSRVRRARRCSTGCGAGRRADGNAHAPIFLSVAESTLRWMEAASAALERPP